MNAAGGTVPDGHYNIQFKLYEGGSGTQAGNPDGTLAWTENYVNNNSNSGIEVRNGYFSVNLGSKTPFGTSVDWNQDTLWLSMNVAGSATDCTTFGSGSCTADGEMLPMKRLTAVPQAMNSARLEGKSASDFIQNTASPQSGNLTVQSANGSQAAIDVQGATSQTADILQVNSNGGSSPLLSVGATGQITLQNATDDASAFVIKDHLGNSVLSVDTTNGTLTTDNTVVQGDLQVDGNLSLADDQTIKSTSASVLQIGNYTDSTGTIQLQAASFSFQNTVDYSTNFSLNSNGEAVFKNRSDSSTAFQIQNASGTEDLFTADTANQQIIIGSGGNTITLSANGLSLAGLARGSQAINLTAEYAGAVLDTGSTGNNSGTMTSSYDMSKRMNYYNWTTSQSTNQSYDIVVQVPIPANFSTWDSGTISVTGYTSDTTNGTIKIQAVDSAGNTVSGCNFANVTPFGTNTWSTNVTSCVLGGGTYTPGGYMTLRIRLQSPQGGTVRVGNISIDYKSKF